MKILSFLILAQLSFSAIGQEMFNVKIEKAGITKEVISEGFNDKSYTTYVSGNFMVIDVFLDKISDDAPRRVEADSVYLLSGKNKSACIGRLDPTTGLLENRWGGLSFYGQGRTETLVFEVKEAGKAASLIFHGQSTEIKDLIEWKHELPIPTLNVTSTKQVSELTEAKSSYGPQPDYNVIMRNDGNFLVVSVEISFDREASPRASDFKLKDKNGIIVSAVGDLKDDNFRHNGNTGSLRLRADDPGKIDIVFPIGQLSAKDAKNQFKLSYAGIAECDLK